ncbi:MAG: DUF1294 domain-containing protein [Bacillota bacterium]|nr:DUF1294 domain-containing protein [Bacillota bacterium]
MKILLIYLIVINFISFALMGIDKQKAKNHSYRIPERTLLIFALVGGSCGALVGMYLFHHKTRHKKFTITVPLFLLLHIAILLYMRGVL